MLINEVDIRAALNPVNLYVYLQNMQPDTEVGSQCGTTDCVLARYLNFMFLDELMAENAIISVGYYSVFVYDVDNCNECYFMVYFGQDTWVEDFVRRVDKANNRTASTMISILEDVMIRRNVSLTKENAQ